MSLLHPASTFGGWGQKDCIFTVGLIKLFLWTKVPSLYLGELKGTGILEKITWTQRDSPTGICVTQREAPPTHEGDSTSPALAAGLDPFSSPMTLFCQALIPLGRWKVCGRARPVGSLPPASGASSSAQDKARQSVPSS